MNSSFLPSLWRFFGLVAVQVLLLKQMGQAVSSTYFNVLLYPLFILFLPLQIAAPYLVLLGFAIGMAVDIFYASPGVHASAGAFSGFLRSVIVGIFAPKGRLQQKNLFFHLKTSPGKPFYKEQLSFFLLHLLWYF